MAQPTIQGTGSGQRERTRAFIEDVLADPSNTQVALGLIQLTGLTKRIVARQREQATVNAMLSKLSQEGPMRSADLAQFLMLDPSTVSRHICSMADDDLVTRTPDEHDRRVQWVTLSETGRERLQALMRERVGLFERILSDWPESDRIAFGALLTRFVTDFDHTLTEAEQA